jgi:hypothetical protein
LVVETVDLKQGDAEPSEATEAVAAVINKVRWKRWPCYFLMVFALATPILAFKGFLLPAAEDPGIWFQRSGAVMTIFSLLCTAGVATALSLLTPSGISDAKLIHAEKEFGREYRLLGGVAFCLTIFGTAVWGYGDLLFNICCKVPL